MGARLGAFFVWTSSANCKAQDLLSPDSRRTHHKYKKYYSYGGLSGYTASSLKAVRHRYILFAFMEGSFFCLQFRLSIPLAFLSAPVSRPGVRLEQVGSTVDAVRLASNPSVREDDTETTGTAMWVKAGSRHLKTEANLLHYDWVETKVRHVLTQESTIS